MFPSVPKSSTRRRSPRFGAPEEEPPGPHIPPAVTKTRDNDGGATPPDTPRAQEPRQARQGLGPMPTPPADLSEAANMALFVKELERWNIRREAFGEFRQEREEEEEFLQARGQAPLFNPASLTSGTLNEPRVKEPDTFSGENPAKLKGFLLQCKLMFSLHASRYQSEEVMVLFMILYLRVPALQPVEPMVGMQPQPAELATVEAFKTYLKSAFGDPDKRGTTKQQLRALQQTKSAAEHFAKVRELVAVAGFTDQVAIVDWAIHGLKPHLKDEIAKRGEFDLVIEIVKFIVPLDNRLRHREEERKLEEAVAAKAKRHKPKYTKAEAPARRPWAERLGAALPPARVSEQRGESLASSGPSGPDLLKSTRNPNKSPTEAEKERLLHGGLCLRCAQDGHQLINCPTAKLRPLPPIPTQGQAPKPEGW